MPDSEPVKPSTPALALSIHTIGHSTLTLDTFAERLAAAGVGGLADVRRFPASRRHPQFDRAALAEGLAARGLEYRWFEALGGRRPPARAGVESSNGGLRVEGFRGYADYALTTPFHEVFAELEAWAEILPVALCCAEALWWQCHRRILADHLVARGWSVLHILADGAIAPHELWSLAQRTSEGLVYPPPQTELFTHGE